MMNSHAASEVELFQRIHGLLLSVQLFASLQLCVNDQYLKIFKFINDICLSTFSHFVLNSILSVFAKSALERGER